MRDQCKKQRLTEIPVTYKDVVIIGNGPAGLTASYILSGEHPVYNGLSHPDAMLSARLQTSLEVSESILDTERIAFLSQGMEELGGTSLLGTLFDSLLRPGTLSGARKESPVTWQRRGRPIDHVVLGDGPPGGIWQRLDPELLTLSLNSWMELPGLRMSQESQKGGARRATVREVAEYYLRYVSHKGLEKYLRDCRVTSVKHLDKVPAGHAKWEVTAIDKNGNKMIYMSRYCILACGSSVPKRLKVPGEAESSVVHDLASLEAKLAENVRRGPRRVLVVGAGLSAADAVLLARFKGCEVIHSFRTEDVTLGQMLPESLYPEYHKVRQMMRDGSPQSYPGYTPLPGTTVTSLSGGVATLEGSKLGPSSIEFSVAAILIGSSADLSFLKGYGRGLHLTEKEDREEICPKENPIAVDPYTYEVRKAPGLYAIGALAGDIYVRYIPGGSVGACAHIVHKLGS